MMSFRHRNSPHRDENSSLPFATMTPPKRRWLFGLFVSLFGHILFYLGFFCLATALAFVFVLPVSFFVDPHLFLIFIYTVPIVVLGLTALPLGLRVVIYGRKMRVRDALTVLSKDRRAPVLYLRSFQDEDLPDPTFRSPFHLTNLPNPFIPQRYEERIAPVLNRIGPAISIGIPGERRAELGTSRVYMHDEKWQAAVQYFAQNAGAVIIVMGRTNSLWWEVDFALANVQRERLLFFFPYADKSSARRRFWRKYYEMIPSITPRSILAQTESERQARYQLLRERTKQTVSGAWPQSLGDAQFLDFKDAGSPRLLPTKRPIEAFFYSIFFPKSVRTWICMRKTLRPFIKKVNRLNTDEN
jgi:hypothetical protein